MAMRRTGRNLGVHIMITATVEKPESHVIDPAAGMNYGRCHLCTSRSQGVSSHQYGDQLLLSTP